MVRVMASQGHATWPGCSASALVEGSAAGLHLPLLQLPSCPSLCCAALRRTLCLRTAPPPCRRRGRAARL